MKITRVRVFEVEGETRSGTGPLRDPPRRARAERGDAVQGHLHPDRDRRGADRPELRRHRRDEGARRAADRRGPDPGGVSLGEAVPERVPSPADRESGGPGPLPLGHHRQGEERAGLPAAGRADARPGAGVRRHARLLDEPERAAERSLEFVEQGFTALKWYLPCNERAGKDGLAAERRAGQGRPRGGRPGHRHHGGLPALGPEAELDPLRDRPGAAAGRVPPDLAGGAAQLRRSGRAREAGRLYPASRWRSASISTPAGRSARSSRAARRRCSQPDANAAGGITEMRKIVTLASTYGLPVVPHANESCRNAVHLLFANTERACPLGEWGEKINANVQYLLQGLVRAEGRLLRASCWPGLWLRARRGQDPEPCRALER